ncbi:MAG TPA: hypothetical protein VJR23_06925 [Candidatus Acidoferrales bacterium]|nr:hypothetical protein [Candidatus Acidoferrales bacterium]
MMRRAKSILAILVLLAMPLALLADAGEGAAGGCNRACCLAHGRHNAASAAMGVAKDDGPMSCHHSATEKSGKCTMKCNQRPPEFGAVAPLPPTRPGLAVSLNAPTYSRGAAIVVTESLPLGFLSEPLDPPRA